MTALEKGLQWERALELFDEMKRTNLPITVVSYGSALSACDKGRHDSTYCSTSCVCKLFFVHTDFRILLQGFSIASASSSWTK